MRLGLLALSRSASSSTLFQVHTSRPPAGGAAGAPIVDVQPLGRESLVLALHDSLTQV